MFYVLIRCSMACVVLSASAFLILYRDLLSNFEMILVTALGLTATWFLSEVGRRHKHEHESKRIRSLYEQLSAETAQRQSAAPQPSENTDDMMVELKVLQELMQQMVTMREGDLSQASDTVVNTMNAAQQAPIQEGAVEPVVDHSAVDKEDFVDQPQTHIIGLVDTPEQEESRAKPDSTLSREELLVIVEKALKQNRIEMLMQPIVSLPQRKPRHFECYSRIRGDENEIYTPDHFLPLAEEKNLVRLVDNAILFRCIQMIRNSNKKNLQVNFFINVSHHTIGDDFFFESLTEFLMRNRELASHMVLEFHADALMRDMEKLKENLGKLRLYKSVCSVDHVKSLDLNLSVLKDYNFKYIKIDSEAFLSFDPEAVKQFFKKASMYNMDVIVAHVESEETLRELQDFSPDYGQGYLFGKPVLNTGL